MSLRLDKTDTKILESLRKDSRKPTAQVAKEVGISRPTAIARIRNLVQKNLIDFGAKVNVAGLGFKLALLNLESGSIEDEQEIMAKLQACPRVLQLVQTVERPTYSALVCAENTETLLSTIECLRSVLGAKIISWQRVKPIMGETFNFKVFLEKCEFTPCGKKCGVCPNYKELECVGCPAAAEYRGTL
jgi:DNA-binding Lrp family transcriptional regulator